jgi:hypothetical protein
MTTGLQAEMRDAFETTVSVDPEPAPPAAVVPPPLPPAPATPADAELQIPDAELHVPDAELHVPDADDRPSDDPSAN